MKMSSRDNGKIIRQGISGSYSSQQSITSKIHLLFLKALEKKKVSESNLYDQINRCTSNIERINAVISILPLSQFVFNDLNIKKYTKSKEVASEFRELGNNYFKSKNYEDAIRAYNLAQAYSPQFSTEYYLAVANRSAALFHINEIELALYDALNAEKGYPKELIHKLEDRKSRCLKLLNIKECPAKDTLSKNQLPNSKKEKRKKYYEDNIFRLKFPNIKIPSAEDFIAIEENDKMGRHVVTNQIVEAGTILIVEKPYAKVLLKEFKWDCQHCHNCHKRTQAGIPCPNCVFAFFCDEECLASGLNHEHKYECPAAPYLHQLNPPRTLILSLKIILTQSSQAWYSLYSQYQSNNVNKLENSKIQKLSLSSDPIGFENGIYDSSSYVPIFNLISHPTLCKGSEILSYSLSALTLVKILEQFTDYFNEFKDNEDFMLFIASLILLHMLNLPCNAHSLNELIIKTPFDNNGGLNNEKLSEEIRTTPCSEYGAGVFALLSLLNHSCEPNVFRINDSSGKTAVISLKQIQKGEEILDNYGMHYALNERNERQLHLEKNYYFKCSCRACNSNWPLFPHIKNLKTSFKCSFCYSMLKLREKDENNWVCEPCGKEFRLSELEKGLDFNIDTFFKAYDLVLENKAEDGIECLKACLVYFDNNLCHPFSKINEAQETLKQAFNLVVHHY